MSFKNQILNFQTYFRNKNLKNVEKTIITYSSTYSFHNTRETENDCLGVMTSRKITSSLNRPCSRRLWLGPNLCSFFLLFSVPSFIPYERINCAGWGRRFCSFCLDLSFLRSSNLQSFVLAYFLALTRNDPAGAGLGYRLTKKIIYIFISFHFIRQIPYHANAWSAGNNARKRDDTGSLGSPPRLVAYPPGSTLGEYLPFPCGE